MKIESKFLTADAELVSIRIEGREMVLEGQLKGFLPMVIRIGPGDLRAFAKALARATEEAIARRLGRGPNQAAK